MIHRYFKRSTHSEAGLYMKKYNESNNDCIRKHLPRQRSVHRIRELEKEYKEYYNLIRKRRSII